MTRVLAHAHSTWSCDGTLTLDDWIVLGRRTGCDVILLSEHEETGWTRDRYRKYVAACRKTSTCGVRLVPGMEFDQDGFHVLCFGLEHLPARPSSAEQLAAAVRSQGCGLCLAHPGKYRWRHPASLIAAVDAVEVWNSKWIYDGMLGPHPASLALAGGKALMVGQDAHKPKHVSPLYMETPTRDVIADLQAGRYRVTCNDSHWAPEELRSRTVAGLVQRCRTEVLAGALVTYRVARRAAACRIFGART